MATKKTKRGGSVKPTVKKRTLNPSGSTSRKPGTSSAPGQEHDAQRRLGNFTTAGEHSRVGGRTSGIVGQTTKRFGTDKRTDKGRGMKKR